MRYLFGPILSRRIGRSLGIDLLPPKTCSMNCIYCECGRTTALTSIRKEWVPTDDVIQELDDYLSENPPLDFITFSGAGEPCLHSGIGTVIRHLKQHYPQYKICLITNSTPLVDPQVREEIALVDRIVPSLDAVSLEPFRKITRPESITNPEAIVDALVAYRSSCPNVEMWLEIFVVPDVNDSDEEIQLLANAVSKIKPHKVQLNMLDRPGCVDWIRQPTPELLGKFRDAMAPYAPVECVGKIAPPAISEKVTYGNLAHRILETCLRRPCTFEDLTLLLELPAEEIQAQIQVLIVAKRLEVTHQDGREFYRSISVS